MNDLVPQVTAASQPASAIAATPAVAPAAMGELPAACFALIAPPATALAAKTAATVPAAPADQPAVDDAGIAALMMALLGVPLTMTAATQTQAPEAAAAVTPDAPPAAASPAASFAAEQQPALPALLKPQMKDTPAASLPQLPAPAVAALAAETAAADFAAALISALPRVDAWLLPAPAAQYAAPVPAPSMVVAPEHPEFAGRFASSVLWSAGQRLEQAEIRLHPRELGSVVISMTLHDDQASVSFSAAHPAARAAITQALPVLREMFAQQGMNLAQAQVFDQAAQQRARVALPGARRAGNEDAGEVMISVPRKARRVGLLDDYA